MKLQINDWEEPHLPQISQHDHVLCLADQNFPLEIPNLNLERVFPRRNSYEMSYEKFISWISHYDNYFELDAVPGRCIK
jgi:hypothetical protein